MRFLWLLAALFPTALSAQTYKCDMQAGCPDGFIPPVIFIGLDRAVGSAAVYDAYVNEVYKAPIPVDTTKRSEALWKLRWTVDGIPTRNSGGAEVRYSATFNIARKTLVLNGDYIGADNRIAGSGRCSQVK
ncbi:MAG: hypothetical protein AAGF60_06390 [Pseudomonadota bacterium]